MTLVRMLLLLPLFLLIGFEAALFSNAPYPWKLGGCPVAGLGACFPVSYDRFDFALDMVFFALLCYWVVIVGIGVHYRLLHAPSSRRFWKRDVLKVGFKLTLLGGFLMLAIPLLALPSAGSAFSGTSCRDPSPCYTQQQQLMAGWNLTNILWEYSIVLTTFVSPLGVLEDKWHRLLGVSLVGVSGLYLAGVEAFFSTGVYALFGLQQAVIGGASLVLGPLLVLSGAFIAIKPPPMGGTSKSRLVPTT